MHSTALKAAVRRSVIVVGIAGGITILGGGIAAASADEAAPSAVAQASANERSGDQTSGEDGAASGNQVEVEVHAPVEISGNQVTVIGNGNRSAGSEKSRAGESPRADVDRTSGEDGAASGNQVEVEVHAPVDASGNQVTVIGDENRSGGSTESGEGDAAGTSGEEGDRTSGEDGTLAGNQVEVDPVVPIDASGNQVTVIGDENRSGGSTESGEGDAAGTTGEEGDRTSGEDGTLAGNQVEVDPVVPVDASGNQVTVIGDENRSGGAVEEDEGSPQDDNIDGEVKGVSEVKAIASGGPGVPATGALAGVEAATGSPASALPQTGGPAGLGLLALVGLCLLLVGVALARTPRRTLGLR